LKRRGDFCAIGANQIIDEEWNQRVTRRRCLAGTGPPSFDSSNNSRGSP
jgi:hypothetical protein